MPMNEDAEDIAYLTAERDKLARDLAVCKIARDGWMKASDEAHARIAQLEAALREIADKADDPRHVAYEEACVAKAALAPKEPT
jgi:hypothetical protein